MTTIRRVSLVCPYDVDVPGGVQSQVLGLARELESLGVNVLVVAPGRVSGVDQRHVERVGRAVAVPVNGSRAPISPQPQAWLRASAACARFAPDVVHVHEPFVPGPALGVLCRRVAPIVGTFHRSGTDALYRVTAPLWGALLRRMDAVVAVSAEARSTLSSVTGASSSTIAIVENAVNVARIEGAQPWPKTRFTYAFVGRHEPRKGLGVLLEAFSASTISASLWVLGDGPESSSLRRRFVNDERITWCGAVDDDELARRLRAADVCVAPSLGGESFGIVLLEAMAAGAAVVASDISGYRLAAKNAAQFVAPGDAPSLRVALEMLFSDDTVRRDLVARGRARVQGAGFSAQASSYLRHYATALCEARARK